MPTGCFDANRGKQGALQQTPEDTIVRYSLDRAILWLKPERMGSLHSLLTAGRVLVVAVGSFNQQGVAALCMERISVQESRGR